MAIKQLSIDVPTHEQMDEFVFEGTLMKPFHHPNLVRLLGMVTQDDPMLLISEYMPHGDLHQFMAGIRYSHVHRQPTVPIVELAGLLVPTAAGAGEAPEPSPHLYMNQSDADSHAAAVAAQTEETASIPTREKEASAVARQGSATSARDIVKRSASSSVAGFVSSLVQKPIAREAIAPADPAKTELSLKDMIGFALDIEHGLAYLANSNFVHRDVAARNMLIAADYTIKITDFGLSRKIDNTKDCKDVGILFFWGGLKL